MSMVAFLQANLTLLLEERKLARLSQLNSIVNGQYDRRNECQNYTQTSARVNVNGYLLQNAHPWNRVTRVQKLASSFVHQRENLTYPVGNKLLF